VFKSPPSTLQVKRIYTGLDPLKHCRPSRVYRAAELPQPRELFEVVGAGPTPGTSGHLSRAELTAGPRRYLAALRRLQLAAVDHLPAPAHFEDFKPLKAETPQAVAGGVSAEMGWLVASWTRSPQ